MCDGAYSATGRINGGRRSRGVRLSVDTIEEVGLDTASHADFASSVQRPSSTDAQPPLHEGGLLQPYARRT
jgi:hypothetical protein